MPETRTSFGDDDLAIISSQTANMSVSERPGSSEAPLQPSRKLNGEVVDLTSSPAMGKQATTAPALGLPSQTRLPFVKRQEPNIFIPKSHHGDLFKTSGPLKPKTSPKKPQALQMFSSNGYPVQEGSQYTKSAADYSDQLLYTDPAKASADLKALLEGGIDDEDEEDKDKEKEEVIDDGTLEGIEVKLLPHQVEGVEWMRNRELGPIKKGKLPKGGILADDMGLGKTLQSISLVVGNRRPGPDDKLWKKHYEHVKKTTLVVAPLALIRQWEAEIKDKVSKSQKLKVCVHHGPKRTKDPKTLALYDVVITTYQILVSEHGHSSTDPNGLQAGCFGVFFWRVILDEAHSIKNRNTKATKAACALRAEFRWCLTGTPMQNSLDELQSLVHFLRIQPYDNLTEWREKIDLPMTRGKGHIAIRRLHSLLQCFMKRRTKAILKEEGALVAGGKKALDAAAARARREAENGASPSSTSAPPAPAFRVTERKVVTVATEFSPAERTFYDALQQRAEASLDKMVRGGKSVNYANALVLLLRLRQACNHPRLAQTDLGKDADALDTLAMSQRPIKKKTTTSHDLDALADALGGMDIQKKQCDMCLADLSHQETADGRLRCTGCSESLSKLAHETPERKKSKKKSRRVSVVNEEITIQREKTKKPRSRKVVLDSDDDEEETDGSWLVPEDQRGPHTLGKAGGEEDENAEGTGDDVGSDDSDHPSEEEDGNLDSFVVEDEQTEDDTRCSDDGDQTDTLVSVQRLQSRVVSSQQTEEELSDSQSDGDEVNESQLDSEDSDDDNHRNGLKTFKTDNQVMMSAKIRELISILRKEVDEHKFIVFSQFTSMLDLVEPFFRAQAGFKSVRYDGKMDNNAREASLHALRTDRHTRVLLCSLKCGSLGLNLTAATRVVIIEPFWNPFVEEQAIDRVHRLTQKVDVVVYKLTVAGTVEERILALQEKKRLLAEAAIEGGMKKKDNKALKLGLNEIMDLFKQDTKGPDADGAANYVGDRVGEAPRGHTSKVNNPPPVHDAYNRRW